MLKKNKPWLAARGPNSKRFISTRTYRTLRKLHRWAGLAALLWLSVLGATGILLDHHEWRFLNQISVPESWMSPDMNRLTRGTIMRHMEIVPDRPEHWIGGSERGLWYSTDAGQSWQDISVPDPDDRPQVFGFAGTANAIYVATDDGIWRLEPNGKSATPFSLPDEHVTSLSAGAKSGKLVGVLDHSKLFRLDLQTPDTIQALGNSDPDIQIAPQTVTFGRLVMDLHFGRGLLAGNGSILLNDLAGVAILVLSITGLLYWWMPKRWKRAKDKVPGAHKRTVMNWLYRFHGPVIGLASAIPILYLSITAIPMDHIRPFLGWANNIELSESLHTPAYKGKSLTRAVEGVASLDDGTVLIMTRWGVLESKDDGASWRPPSGTSWTPEDDSSGLNGSLFRTAGHVFATDVGVTLRRPVDGDDWQALSGPRFRITGGAFDGTHWHLKNSQAFFEEQKDGTFARSDRAFPPLAGYTTLFLFIADIHTGLVIHDGMRWVNDLVSVLAIFLVISGPIVWLRVRWM